MYVCVYVSVCVFYTHTIFPSPLLYLVVSVTKNFHENDMKIVMYSIHCILIIYSLVFILYLNR